MSLVYQQ